MKFKSTLQVEQLEIRRMLSADATHLVMVTHGWNGEAGGWPTEMRSAIANQSQTYARPS